jgi:hypothetical protein
LPFPDDGKCTHSCVSNFAVTGHSSSTFFFSIRVRGLSLFSVHFLHLIGNSFSRCLVFVFANLSTVAWFRFLWQSLLGYYSSLRCYIVSLRLCLPLPFFIICFFCVILLSGGGGVSGEVPGKDCLWHIPAISFSCFCVLVWLALLAVLEQSLWDASWCLVFSCASLSFCQPHRVLVDDENDADDTDAPIATRRRRPRRRREHQSCRTGIVSILGDPEVTVQILSALPRRSG